MFNSEYISNTGVMGEKPFNCSKCNRKFCDFFNSRNMKEPTLVTWVKNHSNGVSVKKFSHFSLEIFVGDLVFC